MGANKLAAAALLAAAAVLYLWLLGTTENPVRDARQKGWQEFHNVSRREQEADPMVRFASSLTDIQPSATLIHRGMVYVPAYARIRLGSGRGVLDLATTLSIHNSSRQTAVLLESVSYYNTEGELVQSYLDRPVALRPLGAIEVFVPDHDVRGGTGANFVIEWASASPVPEPVIEAVMIGTIGTTSYSFVSQGRSVAVPAAN
jgi:hypothetical protein